MTPARPDNFRNTRPQRSAAIWLGGLWAVMGLVVVAAQFIAARPPAFAALTVETDTLSSYVRMTLKDRHILVPVTGGMLRIDNTCALWDCDKPEALAMLGDGDRLQVWRSGNTIWQLAYDGKSILAYGDAVAAAQRGTGKTYRMFLPMTGLGLILFTLGWFQRLRKTRRL